MLLLSAPLDQLAQAWQAPVAGVRIGGNSVLPAAGVARPGGLDEEEMRGVRFEPLAPVLGAEVGVEVALWPQAGL